MATRGARCGLRRLTLTCCSRDSSTALRVTSDPVPAVVGMATNGKRRPFEGQPATDDFQVVERVAPVGGQGRDGLAGVERAAAAEGQDPVAALGQHPRHARPRQLDRRFSGDRQLDPGRRSPRASSARRRSARSVFRPVTSRSRPSPAPRTTSPACGEDATLRRSPVSRSQTRTARRDLSAGRARSPSAIIRVKVGVLPARARLGHHGGHRVPPGLVVGGLLVGGGSVGRAVGLARGRTGSDRRGPGSTSKRAMPGSCTLARALASVASRKASTCSGFTRQ